MSQDIVVSIETSTRPTATTWIDRSVNTGIVILAFGMVLAVLGAYNGTGGIQEHPTVVSLTGIPCFFFRPPAFTPLGAATQTVFFLGALVLLIKPAKVRAWLFIVVQLIAAGSAAVPALGLGTWWELGLRTVLSLFGLAILYTKGAMPGSPAVLLNPITWLLAPTNRYGPAVTVFVGAELLAFGYACMGTSQICGFVLVGVGCLWLGFASLAAWRAGDPLGLNWLVLNWGIYVPGSAAIVLLLLFPGAG